MDQTISMVQTTIPRHTGYYVTMHILNILKENYKGEHTAPTKNSGDPLHDVTQSVYPDDIYTLNPQTAARYYGHSIPEDMETILIIQNYKNKPNKPIKIYRAVPKFFSDHDKEIPKLESLIRYFNTFSFFPVNNPIINKYEEQYEHDNNMGYDEKIEKIYNQILKDINNRKEEKQDITINPLDWVTINRKYAIDHGKSALKGNYKILSKTVKANQIFTNGDSIHEWGYDP